MPIIFEIFIHDWLSSRQIVLKPKTLIQYRQVLDKYIIPFLGEITLQDLCLSQIESLYQHMLSDHIGLRTIRLTHAVLHSSLERAVKLSLIEKNPADGATLPRMNFREMRILNDQQVGQFLDAAQRSRHKTLYHLALATGMREGELLGLYWSDIDWQTGTLYVKRQMQHIPHQGVTFTSPKSRSGVRAIMLGEGTLALLRSHQDQEAQRRGWFAIPNDLVFPSTRGTPLMISNLRKDFKRVLKRAGLADLRFHDLRHTAASLMLNHGIPVTVVSKRLGHSKPSITFDVYAHVMTEMQGEAAKLIDDIIIPTKATTTN